MGMLENTTNPEQSRKNPRVVQRSFNGHKSKEGIIQNHHRDLSQIAEKKIESFSTSKKF
jgi:hypothetical protein